MVDYARLFALRRTPQSEPIPGTVANAAGGHAFPVDDWIRFDRFLVLGAEGGSYYAGERALTRDNAAAVLRCIAADGARAVARIVAISESGRAPKNDPALFALALAMAAGDAATRAAAGAALPRVARTGTHLFRFAEAVQGQRGWGRGLRRAVARWYLARPVDELAYQAVKYRQREGWSHRDLLRLAHPPTDEPARRALFDWVCRGTVGDATPRLLGAAEALARAGDAGEAAALIRAHGLPREAVPTTLLNEPAVWLALLERMPAGALVRSLAKLTAIGVLPPLGAPAGPALEQVLAALGDAGRIARARLHPLSLLVALRTYAEGQGDKGRLRWTPVPAVVDALEAAFYAAFRAVEPTGRRLLLALDVSGSMSWGQVAGAPLTPREASAALALVTASTERQCDILGFTAGSMGRSGMSPLRLAPGMRLEDAVQAVSGLPFGGTDCALPMLHALERGLAVDAFVVLTDSETWAGAVHPVQALRQYRERTGIAAKLVVVGMVANRFSIADPEDAGMLDVVGFDSAAPALIADFIRQ
ncbi:MAG: TROVE domain-containing protein [Dongiaceae bacterium]